MPQPEICFKQFYLPPIQNAEHVTTLCQMQAECSELFAEGWILSHELALPGGREVLFTFQREAEVNSSAEFARFQSDVVSQEAAFQSSAPRKPGRPRRSQESESTPDGL